MTVFKKIEVDPGKIFSEVDLRAHPGGVKVMVTFFDPRSGKGVLFVPDGISKWSYDFPAMEVVAGQSLFDVTERIAELVRNRHGVGFTFATPSVVVAMSDGLVLHVLMLALSTISHRSPVVELAGNVHKYSGYTHDNLVAEHLLPRLGWATADLQAA